MPASPEKIAANRANALKSTGPKTAAGKAVSRCNAVKHALFAKNIVICAQQFQESTDDFQALCQDFYARLQPLGPLEEVLVDQIIQATWRFRRSCTAEAASITLNLDLGTWERQRPHPKLERSRWENSPDPVWEMENSTSGTGYLLDWLHAIRKRVETDGELTEAALKIPLFGRPNQLSDDLKYWRNKYAPTEDTPAARKAANDQLLAYLDRRIRTLYAREEACEHHEESVEQSLQAVAVLPDGKTLDRILRYQTTVERQLYRAMTQLERLQRQRRGSDAPSPEVPATPPSPEHFETNPTPETAGVGTACPHQLLEHFETNPTRGGDAPSPEVPATPPSPAPTPEHFETNPPRGGDAPSPEVPATPPSPAPTPEHFKTNPPRGGDAPSPEVPATPPSPAPTPEHFETNPTLDEIDGVGQLVPASFST